MSKIERFTFLLDGDEKEQLLRLADHLHRTPSSTVRVLISTAYGSLALTSNALMPLPPEVVSALTDGRLKVADLNDETLGLGDLSRYDLTAYEPKPKKK